MATAKGLYPEGFSGRVGNLVCYQWRGKCCVRSMPTHYSDAQTEHQLAQRALFKAMVGFARHARVVLRQGLRTASVNAHITEYNYFMRINKGCFAIVDGGLEVDYENLVLADGPVAPVAFGAPRLLDDTTITIDFEKNPLHRVVSPDDCVYLAAYCPELGDFDLSAGALRRSNQLTMSLNPYWAGREVHLWGFVVDSKGRASMSQYLGCGTLSVDEAEEESQTPIDEEFASTEGDTISTADRRGGRSSSAGPRSGDVPLPAW